MNIENNIYKEIEKAEKQEKKNTKIVLKEIREQINPYKYKKLREFLYQGDTQKIWNLKITDKPTLDNRRIQDEPYWFKKIWVYQTCGMCGDDYSGTINIPITENMYLCFDFEC